MLYDIYNHLEQNNFFSAETTGLLINFKDSDDKLSAEEKENYMYLKSLLFSCSVCSTYSDFVTFYKSLRHFANKNIQSYLIFVLDLIKCSSSWYHIPATCRMHIFILLTAVLEHNGVIEIEDYKIDSQLTRIYGRLNNKENLTDLQLYSNKYLPYILFIYSQFILQGAIYKCNLDILHTFLSHLMQAQQGGINAYVSFYDIKCSGNIQLLGSDLQSQMKIEEHNSEKVSYLLSIQGDRSYYITYMLGVMSFTMESKKDNTLHTSLLYMSDSDIYNDVEKLNCILELRGLMVSDIKRGL